MKKILALLLLLVSTTAFADIGLFFDGTARFARTGVIQASYPDISLCSGASRPRKIEEIAKAVYGGLSLATNC
jgi:hypothetical protein